MIFSFVGADAEPVHEYINDIFATAGEYQKYLISRLPALHAENFVFFPALFGT